MRAIRSVGRHAVKVLVIALLAVPAVVGYLDDGTKTFKENRRLADMPAMPATWAQLLETPPKLTAWVNDHFGFRTDLVQFTNEVRFAVFKEFPSIQMAVGQNGRYFLAAHALDEPPFQAFTRICGKMSTARPSTIPYLNRMFAAFEGTGIHPRLLIVPSAPVVYSEDVPAFLVKECSSPDTPVSAMLRSSELRPEAAKFIMYPLQEMREIKKSKILYPETWFHWTGDGLGDVAGLTMDRFWGLAPLSAPPLAIHKDVVLSDVSYLFEGITLKSEIVQPDMHASGATPCWGVACFPEIDDVAKVLGDVTRFKNPKARQRRLLIISDSFGSKIAPWYARYYNEVEQVATNNVPGLTAQQVARMRSFIFRNPADTDVLFVYHDGGAMYDTLRLGTQALLPDTISAAPMAAAQAQSKTQ